MEGEEWLETRRVLNKLVLRPSAQEWGEDPTSLVVDNLVADWKNKSSKGGFEADLENDLYRLSLDGNCTPFSFISISGIIAKAVAKTIV